MSPDNSLQNTTPKKYHKIHTKETNISTKYKRLKNPTGGRQIRPVDYLPACMTEEIN